MPVLEASTVVHRDAEPVFDALLDLRRYEGYSDHLAEVRRVGDGGVGTEYELRFQWWLVSYVVRSRVTAVERPSRLDFEVTKGIAATGSWLVDAVDPADGTGSKEGGEAGAAPTTDEGRTGGGPASRVRFVVEYDPDSVAGGAVSLPSLVSLSWVVDRVAPLVEREAERVVERVVADLEGRPRPVDLEVTVR